MFAQNHSTHSSHYGRQDVDTTPNQYKCEVFEVEEVNQTPKAPNSRKSNKKEKKSKNEQKQYFCEICKVTLNTKAHEIAIHNMGRKHRKKCRDLTNTPLRKNRHRHCRMLAHDSEEATAIELEPAKLQIDDTGLFQNIADPEKDLAETDTITPLSSKPLRRNPHRKCRMLAHDSEEVTEIGFGTVKLQIGDTGLCQNIADLENYIESLRHENLTVKKEVQQMQESLQTVQLEKDTLAQQLEQMRDNYEAMYNYMNEKFNKMRKKYKLLADVHAQCGNGLKELVNVGIEAINELLGEKLREFTALKDAALSENTASTSNSAMNHLALTFSQNSTQRQQKSINDSRSTSSDNRRCDMVTQNLDTNSVEVNDFNESGSGRKRVKQETPDSFEDIQFLSSTKRFKK